MSTDLVPFQQMEKMAVSVANSKLFGCKSKDEAIALFLLAQAEGVHVMTAVRDFCIIQGRPAMKAEAMVARFQAAGGRIQWHVLSDTKAEASFSHPTASPDPVRIEWSIERAQRAGLANRDVWKAYPRAMLRSRVVSEGIRTVMPGVLSGAYTSEEAMHIETVEPVSSVESIGTFMPAETVSEHSANIRKAQSMEQLRDAFKDAYVAAKAIGDERVVGEFTLIKDERKGELEARALNHPSEEHNILGEMNDTKEQI